MKTSLRIAAVQMNSGDDLAANVARIAGWVARATRGKRPADVILFPECATTGYARGFGSLDPVGLRDAIAALRGIASRHAVNLLVGTPWFVGDRLFNALLVLDRRGRIAHAYAKCHLTAADRRWFAPGNGVSLFRVDGVPATAIICHERRYPELVRVPVMAGARLVFHPNAGLDRPAVSRAKRGGRDGIAARAFENAVPYVFANTVGPQGGGRWSAGDSKIVGADGRVLRLGDNASETMVVADVDLSGATGKYAVEGMRRPTFLARHWRAMIAEARVRAREFDAAARGGKR